jgi:hypothetical protein
MTDGGPTSPVDEMRQFIRKQVAGGFLDADEVEQAAIDCFEYDLDGTATGSGFAQTHCRSGD